MLFKRQAIAAHDEITFGREGIPHSEAVDDQPLISLLNDCPRTMFAKKRVGSLAANRFAVSLTTVRAICSECQLAVPRPVAFAAGLSGRQR